MNKYEIMFILKSNDEEAIKSEVSSLKAIITDMKGEITEEKEMGNRKLAEFDRKARISENVIRHLVIRLDEE